MRRDEEAAGGVVLPALAAGEPNDLALLHPGRAPVSFACLRSTVDSLAGGLLDFGIARTDLVALALPDSRDLLTAVLAVAQVAAATPLDCTLPEAEYHALLTRLKVRALIARAGGESRAYAAARALGIPVGEWNCGENGDGGVTWTASDAGAPPRTIRRLSEGVVLVLQTSATTGCPKLVPLTSGNLCAIAGTMQRVLQLNRQDRFLSILPFTHLLGLACALAQLQAGGSVICVDGFRTDAFGWWLDEFRPTWYSASPTMHRAILSLMEARGPARETCSLRFVRSGSASLDASLADALERALHVPVIDGYGLSEAGQVTSNRPWARKPGSVGSSAGPMIRIVDEGGNVLPAGSEGEVVLRGPAIMSGYLDDPEDNASTFRDGWFRTGDLGRLDDDGYLFLTGRLKETINRGGETIGPWEIDAALAAHPAVARAVAFGIPHPTLGEDVAAAVVLNAGASASEFELRQFVAARLARFKVPSRIVLLERIPEGRSGKPSRSRLAEQFGELAAGCAKPPGGAGEARPAGSGRLEVRHASAARTASFAEAGPALPSQMEQHIAKIWMRILGTAQPGPSDDFFALGGDSLSAARMLQAVREELQVDKRLLERVDFFESPTVAQLAEIVADCGGAGSAGTAIDTSASSSGEDLEVVLRAGGARAPFFCFPGASQDVYYLRHLAKFLGDERSFIVLRHAVEETGSWPMLDDLAGRFVARIRKLKPAGPLVLGGHCYGGILAYESALRLIALGESVPLLVLFDTPTPGYPKPSRHWKRYIQQLRRGEVSVRQAVEHYRFVTRRMGWKARNGRVRAGAAAGTDGNGGAADPRAATIVHGYVPRPFPGKIVHFIAGEAQVSSRVLEDARLGWRDFARGGFEVQHVGGLHDSMFVEAHARDLAARLQAVFRCSLPDARSAAGA